MALPLGSDLREHLRIETNAEDIYLGKLITRAIAKIENHLHRRILSASAPMEGSAAYPIARSLRGPNDAASATEVLVGENAAPLDTRGDYTEIVEPILTAAILDVAADLYKRRVPTVAGESGGGISVTYTRDGIPMRVATDLRPYRAT